MYLSGRFVTEDEAGVPLTDRGLTFGDGVYEVYRLYRGRPFRMKAHLERLRRSAAEIRLRCQRWTGRRSTPSSSSGTGW